MQVQKNGAQTPEQIRSSENGRPPDPRQRSAQPQNGREIIERRCEQCGRVVTSAKKDGETVSVKSILAASQREYQKNLCADCLLAKRAEGNTTSAAAAPAESVA